MNPTIPTIPKKLKVEIWSDFACPFCFVAKRHFEQALSQFNHAQDIEIIHKSYRLDPTAGNTPTYSMQDKLQKVYGKTPKQALEMIDFINQAGQKVGLTMNVEKVQNTNTHNAHRLLKWATDKGFGEKMNERLFLAYFTESQNLADNQILANLAEQVGLDRAETLAMLDSDAYRAESLNDELQARELGISSVPFFVIDEKYAVQGAQPPELFVQAFNQVLQENQSDKISENGLACDVNGCQI